MAENNLPEIVLVDDDPEALMMMRELLERGGVEHPIRAFESGEAAIEYFLQRSSSEGSSELDPCLALVDVRMPGMSGLEVLGWIKGQARWRFLPVVLLTISNDPEDIRRAQELGADTYLLKFPLAETLAALVREAEKAVTSSKERRDS
jgi:CheY-like chemotaxis protein